MKPGASVAVRAGLVMLCLWAVFGSRSGTYLLELLLPAQRAVYAALMPDFEIRSFDLHTRAAHVTLRATTQSRRYLVMGDRAHPPGIEFVVETPARTALLLVVLIVAGALLTVPAQARACGIAAMAVVPTAALMATVPLPLILAGEQWGLAVEAGSEPSLRAVLVAASGFLLHGGGYALCAATVWAVAAAARRHTLSRARARRASRPECRSLRPS